MDRPRCETVAGLTRDVSFEGMAFEHPVALKENLFLTFFPALALGPIVEHLQMIAAAGH